ncbi:MAG: YdiU family protein, partial [Balneolales bacterium]|nr:YdiU family protein [Balneolales bacterium]
MINFQNTYVRLPETFYERIVPTVSTSSKLIKLNTELARELGIENIESDGFAAIFAGNTLLDGSEPLAMAYAGHQFGHFVPQLGDGRAILLGEVIDGAGNRRDIQLKGAGRTRFSRGGDGRAALGPVLREYIVSEAMHALGVRTSRSLAAVLTGDPVYRETPLPGAILTRVASSHIRVGTFEYFAARQDTDSIKVLADYVIERHYPDLGTSNVYAQLFNSIAAAQADLVSDWMRVGFIHGVMNTDNITVSGETIDYGPCAFMDEYDHGKVFSSIDQYGRYAFGNQPKIMQWNLENLGACLVPLFGEDEEQAIEIVKNGIRMFQSEFTRHWQEKMCAKIGIFDSKPEDLTLLQ